MELDNLGIILVTFTFVPLILCKISKAAKYYIKMVFYSFSLILVSWLLIPVFLLRPKNVKNLLIYANMVKHLTIVLGIKWTLRGREHLSQNKPCVLIANHQTCLDALGIYRTRRNTGEIHAFKKGAFYTAIHHQVPIIPVVFSSYRHFMDHKKKVFDEGEIIINALPEISTIGLGIKDIDDLMERTKQQMIDVYDKISEEVSEKSK
ncbi:1-acyl-sn-glycerol-3-phosphate acyltransferase alpha-like [Chironomus tepperi]|uniref:1-acyl-sn-glycerol-3-phosphate acyltransferase alpha-like n=1 Tax=Chironomus tepperi TaxID=113505 RepID=UPI00391EFD35